MTPEGKRLFDAFDKAAKHWGWESDQGYGSSVKRSEATYIKTHTALKKYIEDLENGQQKT